MNRLQKLYQDKIKQQLQKELKITNPMAVPKLEKIVVNMGTGDLSKDKIGLKKVLAYISMITGQKPQIRSAKKSIAEFSIRDGDTIGVRVTLRGSRAYDFLDRLISIVLPRVRDFQGVSLKSFDGHGNYNLGIKEQIIFPEIDYDTIDRVRGLQITINTTAKDNAGGLALLKSFNMPFEKNKNK